MTAAASTTAIEARDLLQVALTILQRLGAWGEAARVEQALG